MITLQACIPTAVAFATLCLTATAGVPITVTATGTVEYNQIAAAPLGNIDANDLATLTLSLDSDDFVNSGSFPTRGYRIVAYSFTLSSGATQVALQNPFPAGQTPYFVIRDNDPAVDGFYVATSVDFPTGVPLAQTGSFGQFVHEVHITYDGSTLPSLNILDALGTYDYTGLQVYGWTVDDGPFNPLSISFEQLKIEATEPAASFCFGDGIDPNVTTACPCANFGQAGHGCGNSVNTAGALLTATGTTSPDTLQFTCSGMPPSTGSIFLQGNSIASAGIVFGDGVRCAAGQLTRLGLRNDLDLDGTTTLGPGAGDAPISSLGGVISGSTYAYQTYYRNPNASWCPPATFNVSNGLTVNWQ